MAFEISDHEGLMQFVFEESKIPTPEREKAALMKHYMRKLLTDNPAIIGWGNITNTSEKLASNS